MVIKKWKLIVFWDCFAVFLLLVLFSLKRDNLSIDICVLVTIGIEIKFITKLDCINVFKGTSFYSTFLLCFYRYIVFVLFAIFIRRIT